MNRLVWFRNDLRLDDNETLTEALANPSFKVSFLYVYDKSFDAQTPEGQARMAPFRKKFLAESVRGLRLSLQSLGGDLICTLGDPVDTVLAVCEKLDVDQVFYSRLPAFDERQQEVQLEKRLESAGRTAFSFETQTLLCPSDLAEFNPNAVMGFTKFRKIVEQSWPIRAPRKPITKLEAALPMNDLGEVSIWDYRPALQQPNPSRGISILGGESAAFERLSVYFWRGDHLRTYKSTRNGLIELDDSSKFSPALALGCLSARRIYSQVRRYEREKISNESTLWFLYELLWRDHFYFQALRRERHLFSDSPASASRSINSESQRLAFEKWRTGRTKQPFVDAGMRELHHTGWLSNRMRQNVASYLVHNLGVDWKMGARWFETCLIDYDPCSNWGNWAYIAGAGKENNPHIFDVEQQAQAYDSNHSYRSY